MEENNDFLKWINGESSDKELVRLKEKENFKTLEKIAHYSSQIATPKIDIAHALKALEVKKKKTVNSGKLILFRTKRLYKYAAAVVLLFTSVYYLTLNSETTLKTEFAQRQRFNLPDNSEVILNANSEISYTKEDWNRTRNISLNGEAYFKVQKGEKFTVQTTLGDISVLGTQFNVKKRAHYFEVKTYEGLVRVHYKNTFIELPKGAVFKVINGVIDLNTTFNIQRKTWLQKESNFKSTPLQFVLEEIENQFDCTIETKNINLSTLYSGGFSHGDLNIALQSVTIPLQLSYEIKGKKITLYNYVR
ncbi:putative transmembrane sensor [Polaribacter irgensii 23-P]|uniref:Putative transmembrane sensor n=1 Tax=Polaribacter irgensii 23-P TaxID=313594 RepID=A4BXC0_9FLAO|nr:FecR family protein [Polaribacter irgensii]EAR13611.1 putative transmembrane sensor [Polaribacter irgensii 23-P]